MEKNCVIKGKKSAYLVDDKFSLLIRNTAEVISEDELKGLLKDCLKVKKQPVVYLGLSVTGRPHVGYFLFVLKLADFLRAGFKVKFLFADLHGALDKTPWSLLEKRFLYYEKAVSLMFKCVGADIKNFEIVRGSDFQLSKDYFFDLLRLSTETSVHDARKAGSEVVKQVENPKLSGSLYPLMQALDEEYLKVDVQLGGLDQRKIMVFARECLPKLGYKKRIEIMFPIIPSLTESGKMSASISNSKIDLLDEPEVIKKKINGAFCPVGIVEGNGILALMKFVIMYLKEDKKETLVVKRPEKFGGDVVFSCYDKLECAYLNKKLHPQDLKDCLARELISLLGLVRVAFKGKEKLVKEAYP